MDIENRIGCLDNFPGLHWILGTDRRGISASAGLLEYTGMTREGFVNDWPAIIHPGDHDARAQKNDSIRAESPVLGPLRIRRFDGSYRWFEIRSRAQQIGTEGIRWFISAWETCQESSCFKTVDIDGLNRAPCQSGKKGCWAENRRGARAGVPSHL